MLALAPVGDLRNPGDDSKAKADEHSANGAIPPLADVRRPSSTTSSIPAPKSDAAGPTTSNTKADGATMSSTPAQAGPNLPRLQADVSSYLQKQSGRYGFALVILATEGEKRRTIGYRQDEFFKMASTIKLPAMLRLYRLVAAHKVDLDDHLTYDSAFFADGTGVLQGATPGQSFSIRRLAELTIRQSDNIAYNMLRNRIGSTGTKVLARDLGGKLFYKDGTAWDSPAALARYMEAVVDFAVVEPELGPILLDDLRHTAFNDRIPAGTPPTVLVAHKIGNLDGVANDVALVQAPARSYVLALMSKGVDTARAAFVEAEVARMVFDAVGR